MDAGAPTDLPDGAAPGTPFRLDGRRALVTGASRGIGAAVAEQLAAAGADLVLTARGAADLGDLAARIAAEHGVRAVPLAADLADPDEVERLATAGWAALGGLDVLVNNAGISVPEPVTGVSVHGWDATMAVNLRAPALLAARVGAAMAGAGEGAIVHVASVAGLRPLAEHYAYCSAKAGLVMASKVLALKLGPRGVRSNVVCPTVILTEMGTRVWGEAARAAPMLARIPAGRFGLPADVAAAVLYLASAEAGMVNGLDLTVDGGYLAG